MVQPEAAPRPVTHPPGTPRVLGPQHLTDSPTALTPTGRGEGTRAADVAGLAWAGA